ncbi:EAL domain-containing protein [Geminicoccus roseus]|uniref:EAL domain-containing protein n=1 Tax=Geminicoccus roseus TaxID=404900 RepID=UPI0004244281|nr:EAL domain-containing protein [Geminicoccus roseus]
MGGLVYLLLAGTALLAGSGGLLAIPDPMLRATVAPAGLTALLVGCGALLLLRLDRRLAGPAGLEPADELRDDDEPPASRRPGSFPICTNEPENPLDHDLFPVQDEDPPAPPPAQEMTPDVLFREPPPRPGPLRDLLDTNEPEQAAPPRHARVRFGAFDLFRRREAPPAGDPAGPAVIDPDDLASFALPPVSPRLLAELDPPADLLDTQDSRGQTIARAIAEDTLVVVLEPVVSLPQRRRRMVRIRLECRHLGTPADPHLLLQDQAGKLRSALDLELLRRAVAAGEQPRPGSENLPVLVEVATGSFVEAEALAALDLLLGRRRSQATPLQVVLDEWPTDRAGLEVVARLRAGSVVIGLKLGERPHLSPAAILGRGVGLVCLDAGELRQAALGAYDADLVHDIQAMQRAGIEVVVTGIGDERALAEVLDYPVRLGTGRLFGRIG